MAILLCKTPWRNGSASDSRSEGCVFESRRGHIIFYFIFLMKAQVSALCCWYNGCSLISFTTYFQLKLMLQVGKNVNRIKSTECITVSCIPFSKQNVNPLPCQHNFHAAVTRIRTWVTSATTKGTNHYTITAIGDMWSFLKLLQFVCASVCV